MRRAFLGLAAALALLTLAPTGRAFAQVGTLGGDPFSLYYGYYLPHAAAVAAQPTPMDTINQNIAQRQRDAMTDRSSLYDPISPYGDSDDDPLSPYSGGRRGSSGRTRQGGAITHGRELTRGGGPSMFYGRTARYFPELRTGRGPNRNLAVTKRGAGGGGFGGGGMPSMPGVR